MSRSRSRGSPDLELPVESLTSARADYVRNRNIQSNEDNISGTHPSVDGLASDEESNNETRKGDHTDAATIPAGSIPNPSSSTLIITPMGFQVLCLLAVQNSSKNLLMRFVMREQPKFLTSAAVIGSESVKLTLSILYILLVEKQSFASIIQYFVEDWRNTLLVTVPASAYNLQMTLEYIALANMDAAMFSVLVQLKLLFTAVFAYAVLGKKLKQIQVISLLLLTVGVMLCNMKVDSKSESAADSTESSSLYWKGVFATFGIAISSGFASVYTEKVIKTQRAVSPVQGRYSLAYTQVQLASMSLVTIGIFAGIHDFDQILQYGLFHNFNGGAYLTVLNSALGGLIVAGVLKYADSVLKGYATATSVIMTGVMSMVLFGTQLNAVYFLGIVNVVVAVVLYNGKNLDQNLCS
jgi:UDP-sugar transporter A1/2/3